MSYTARVSRCPAAFVNLRRAGGGQRLQQQAIRIVNIIAPKNENHFVDPVLSHEEISRGFYCDLRRFRDRITICAATDRRKSNRLDAIFNRELQRAPIAIRQDLRLMAFSSSPNRANCVNDKTRRQTISASNFRCTGSTTAEGPAVRKQLRASPAVNRAIDSATAEERSVRRVYDGIDIEFRDIPLDDLDLYVLILVHEPFVTMTNDERNQNDQMTKPDGPTGWRNPEFVIPSSIDIRAFVISHGASLSISQLPPTAWRV